MSEQTFTRFLLAADSDADLAVGLLASVEGKDGDAAVNAVSAFATANGYPLTPAEVDAGRMQILDVLERQAELSDAQLDTVSGGIDLVTASIGLLGMTAIGGTLAAAATGVATGAMGGFLIGASSGDTPGDKLKSFIKGW